MEDQVRRNTTFISQDHARVKLDLVNGRDNGDLGVVEKTIQVLDGKIGNT